MTSLITRGYAPLLKWAGGKESELTILLPLFPKDIYRYHEPFFGGGAAFFAVCPQQAYLNDACPELMAFYQHVAEADASFRHTLKELLAIWECITNFVESYKNELGKLADDFEAHWFSFASPQNADLSMIEARLQRLFLFRDDFLFWQEIWENCERKAKQIEKKAAVLSFQEKVNQMETALKSAFYMMLRHFFNRGKQYNYAPGMQSALFFFVRELCYSSLFRYNKSGEFNIPYTGFSANRKNIGAKVARLFDPDIREMLSQAKRSCLDFEDYFAEIPIGEKDFILLDPPYDSRFSTYAGNPFTLEDHVRLARYLLLEKQARWMLVIKETPFIRELYQGSHVTITPFPKTYKVNIQSRNDREAVHLIIRNYAL